MAIFILLLLASLFQLAFEAEQVKDSSGETYVALFAFNAFGLLVLTLFIGINAWNLYDQIRKQAAGSRLTARLVVLFVLLTLIPVSLVFVFSVRFINNSIDSWFDVRVENAMSHAIELSRDALGVQMRTYRKEINRVVSILKTTPEHLMVTELEKHRSESDASEYTLLTVNNRVIASSTQKLFKVIPSRPDENILLQVRRGEPYIGLDPSAEGLVIKVVMPFVSKISLDKKMILLALYPVSSAAAEQAKKVEEGVQQYKQLVFLRTPLKVSYILTLSLMLLMSVLTAVLAAFYMARKMMAPVNQLVAGTRDVAAGNYDTRLPPSGNDELGYLVQSFNIMMFRLQNADKEIRKTQDLLEQQRRYLYTVLSSLSSGVMSINENGLLQVYNDAASQFLETDLEAFEDREVDLIKGRSELFNQFCEQVNLSSFEKASDWQSQIEVFGSSGRRVLLVKGTQLLDENQPRGTVLVFDDITQLINAQKNAAWSEVARRLAHEIKNPLTPIQLATERIRKKYLNQYPVEDSALMDKCTLTIIKQVHSMQTMVKAFADYANMPKQRKTPIYVNKIIEETVDLYQSTDEGIVWSLDLAENEPKIEMDPSRLRQVLGNLIKNAIESMTSEDEPWIGIKTRWVTRGKNTFLEIDVADNGEGIDPEIKERMFDAYNTSKPEGTGLGLAIVKNIVEESGGIITVEARSPKGTQFKLTLPKFHKE